MDLSHINKEGNAKMVDVSNKDISLRIAKAKSTVKMKTETLTRILEGGIKKGDVISVAQVAGIMAAKKTHEIIPMCHPLLISNVNMSFNHDLSKGELYIESLVKVEGKTGVEMEALTATSVAALTVYDMCKAIDKEMVIADTKLIMKTGGKYEFRRL